LVFYEQQAFLNSIRTGRPPLCDHNVGKMASAVALAAERSARENRLVALSELR
jgi:predicted dehydrogenase